jgi:O-antigen/teichoic acid export membrane protein
LAIAAPVAIPIVFGTAFARSIGVVLWILPGTVALSLGKVACADLAGRGKNGYSSIFALIGFAITIGLDWLLIPRLGIIGAAIASSIAYSANTFLILLAVRHELHVTWAEILLPTVQDIATFRAAWSRLVQNCLDYFTQTRKESRSFQSTGDEPKHE